MKTRIITNDELNNTSISGGNFLINLQDGAQDPQYVEYLGRLRESREYFYQPVEPVRPPRQVRPISREIRPIELV